MFTTPTYFSIKLLLSPVEDVTQCLVYHMFTVCVYCLCLCLLSCCLLAGLGWAGSCSFTSALVVCRLATVCPPVWPGRSLTGVKLPGLVCWEWGTRGPGHRAGTQGAASEVTRRHEERGGDTPLVSGIMTWLGRGQDIIRYSDQWERDGPGLNYI